MEAIAANLADVGIKADIKIWETAAISWRRYPGKKLRGLIVRNSWYDAEQNAGADLEDGYALEAPYAYVTTKEISDTLKQTMRALTDKEAAEMGPEISQGHPGKSSQRPSLVTFCQLWRKTRESSSGTSN